MTNIPSFDPTKMDPKVLMEMSQLIQQLSPAQMNRLQTLMHNMMAGLDVKREMEEFENTLPPGFRDKLVNLMAAGDTPGFAPGLGSELGTSSPLNDQRSFGFQNLEEAPAGASVHSGNMDVREARLTILRAVASGGLSPEDAEPLLFKD